MSSVSTPSSGTLVPFLIGAVGGDRPVVFDGPSGRAIKAAPFTLPADLGDAGQALLTNADGTTAWGDVTGGSGITALTSDVTASGTGSVAATIASNAVTYAKMQDVSAADKLLGRGNGGGAGDPQEITLGTNLSMSGTTLNAASGLTHPQALARSMGA